MIETVLLRAIPEFLQAGVASGDYKVYGSIIRSISSGRIVGHLQETSLLGQLPLPGLSMAGQVANLGMGAVQIAQNEQIKAAISVLQSMQVADLALGAAGIGVTAVSAAILFQKIDRVEMRIGAMDKTLERIERDVAGIRAETLGDLLARLRAAAEQLEEGWRLADPVHQWRQVALEAHTLSAIFERRLTVWGGKSVADPILMEPLMDAMALAGATRVTARLACNDIDAAVEAARSHAEALAKVGEPLQLMPLALKAMSNASSNSTFPEWKSGLEEVVSSVRPALRAMRRREAAAASGALTVAEIRDRGIVGREWLEAARSETEQPLLFLPSREEGVA